MTRLTLFKSSLQTSYQTPVASPFLTTVLDDISLVLRLFTPEAKIQEIHDKDEVESGLVLCFRMQIMFGPSLGAVTALLHLLPDQLGSSSSATGINVHVNAIVIDEFGVSQHFRIGSDLVRFWLRSQ